MTGYSAKMENRGKFYVYEHWRPDTDLCFYVGKGSGNRARDFKKRRNKHYRGIVKKLTLLGMCVEVRMVASGLTEETAFALEIERIAFWLSSGISLANKTGGGDGLSNPSPEVRARLAEAARLTHTGRKQSPEQVANKNASLIETFKDPIIREKRRIAAKNRWADKEFRAKVAAGVKRAASDPAIAARRSASQMGNKKGLGKSRSAGAIAKQIVSFKLNREKNPITDQMRANISAGQKRRFAVARAKKDSADA